VDGSSLREAESGSAFGGMDGGGKEIWLMGVVCRKKRVGVDSEAWTVLGRRDG